jgi:hypothetical protein
MSLEHSPARQRRVHEERLIGEPECREIKSRATLATPALIPTSIAQRRNARCLNRLIRRAERVQARMARGAILHKQFTRNSVAWPRVADQRWPVFVLKFRSQPHVDHAAAIRALRQLLTTLLRRHGLKCRGGRQ